MFLDDEKIFFLFLVKLHCCGNHGYDDWNKLERPMPIPKSCCQIPNCDAQDDTQIYTEVKTLLFLSVFFSFHSIFSIFALTHNFLHISFQRLTGM